MTRWYALVGHDVVGPFDTSDDWYHEHGGPDWREIEMMRTGVDPWHVARTELGDGRYVSTVFLGLDYGWIIGCPVPLVFETMSLPDCELCERAATWEQAVAQHAAMVAQLRGSCGRVGGDV